MISAYSHPSVCLSKSLVAAHDMSLYPCSVTVELGDRYILFLFPNIREVERGSSDISLNCAGSETGEIKEFDQRDKLSPVLHTWNM